MGNLPGYGLVWFNEEGISNILSMANATKKYPFSYVSEARDRFILNNAYEPLVFNRIPSGPYFNGVKDWDILMVATTTVNC